MRENTDFISINDKDLNGFFKALTGREIKRAFRAQLKKSCVVMAKETTALFKKRYNYKGPKRQTVRRKNGKFANKVRRIAKITSKSKGGDITVKVHIMDDNKAKWFESGTEPRFTKGPRNAGYYKLTPDSKRRYVQRVGKPGYRGKLKAGHFFQLAQQKTEREVIRNIDKNLGHVIQEAINKGR